MLDANGYGTHVRITGPTDPGLGAFRACVVQNVGHYLPDDGNTHVSLTLP